MVIEWQNSLVIKIMATLFHKVYKINATEASVKILLISEVAIDYNERMHILLCKYDTYGLKDKIPMTDRSKRPETRCRKGTKQKTELLSVRALK